LAGAGESKGEPGSTERFRIVINLGADTKEFIESKKTDIVQEALVEDAPTVGQLSLAAPSVETSKGLESELSEFPQRSGK
jgi:hypothetical protein